MMQRTIAVALVGVVMTPVPAFERPSQLEPMSVCQIAADPAAFHRDVVLIRSRVLIGFEQFAVSAASCAGARIDSIWLEYGSGPARQPTTWCCGDMVPRDETALVQDSEFRTFHRYLTVRRPGKGCDQGKCYAYDVTATLMGRLDSARLGTCPNGLGGCCEAGFGHFGAYCARLVIQKVTDVVAHRKPR